MKISKAVTILDEAFFPELQEKYDNSGRQIVFHDAEVSGLLLALDVDVPVIEEAEKKECNLIVSHHPLFFYPARSVDSRDPKSALAISLIDRRISVYSAHTNLDKIYFDRLARALGLPDPVLLNKTDEQAGFYPVGYGVISRLPKPLLLSDLLETVKTKLMLDFVVYSGELSAPIRSVAVMQGAGGRSIEKIVAGGSVECIITGDVGYHHARTAGDHGVAVIDAGHFGTERVLLTYLKDQILDLFGRDDTGIKPAIHISGTEKSPFKIYG